jgi:hypothetical protein
LMLSATKRANDNAGNTAETYLGITNAKSYAYSQWISKPGDFAGAAEYLDVTGAQTVTAGAKAYNTQVAGPDVGVSTTVSNGDLHGYNNMAIASAGLKYAFQSFDSATGTMVKCDSVAMNLPAKYSAALEKTTLVTTGPEASISTTAVGTVTNYEDAVVKSSLGTSIEQNAHVQGTFTSTSSAKGTPSLTRTSDYGTKYDIDMQANIANSLPSVRGTLAYYINPTNLKIQTAVDKSLVGDTINLAPGTYKEQVNIQKAVTVRGDGVTVTNGVTNPNGVANVYIDSTKVFIRADDLRMMSELQPTWTWFTNLISSKNAKATIAVIPQNSWGPDDSTSIANLQSFDKKTFELATHGYTHEDFVWDLGTYANQYSALKSATDLMTKYLYKPRTFVAPYLDSNVDTLNACKALGYHTIVGGYVAAGETGINQQYGNDFEWEKWVAPDWHVEFSSIDQFRTVFDSKYNSGAAQFEIQIHPEVYWGAQNQQDQIAQSMDYMKSKTNQYGSGVDFMTFDQYYRYKLYNQ